MSFVNKRCVSRKLQSEDPTGTKLGKTVLVSRYLSEVHRGGAGLGNAMIIAYASP